MLTHLAQRAISAALRCDWEEAIKLNQEILNEYPQDVDALTRCARAYFEVGNLKKAKQLVSKTLKYDPLNTIAKRNLEKWEGFTISELKSYKKGSKSEFSYNLDFLEQPGKTKVLTLIHLGDRKLISYLHPGDSTLLLVSKHRVSITTLDGKYIGRLPDDSARKIITTIKEGSWFKSIIKCADPDDVKVFLKQERQKDS